ncbi:SDR family NAD(P)-dependent oxidoreductase [Ralstonia pseudosolanacearum]|uniref:SDR family NAD(P)-dependent oxidoreductase n=1 Tax=Ralstonia pseudosolanacearum TaxID=1310165 RepID=UPI00142D6C0F|nr:SDR family NAD(P)-dependent oxidoreductase [Ralstonia pseudosolanacearum]
MKGRRALITGGTSGIGAACVRAFLHAGADVICIGRSGAKADRLYDDACGSAGTFRFFECDLLDRSAVDAMFDAIEQEYGRIDYAINSAGTDGASFTGLCEYPDSAWDEVMELNVTSVWRCMRRELALMRDVSGAAIVNVASVAGLQASLTGGCAYTASKHAVIGLTRTAAVEFAVRGIRVNAICPGLVRTPMAQAVLGDRLDSMGQVHPIGRLCEPEEVASAIFWLCGDGASFVTGAAVPVDGGVMA